MEIQFNFGIVAILIVSFAIWEGDCASKILDPIRITKSFNQDNYYTRVKTDELHSQYDRDSIHREVRWKRSPYPPAYVSLSAKFPCNCYPGLRKCPCLNYLKKKTRKLEYF